MKKNRKDESFKIKIVAIIILLIILPFVLVILGVNILRELIILFWILLLMNFLSLIVTSFNRLSNNILLNKLYNSIFKTIYNKNIYINTKDNETLIISVIKFYKIEKNNIDFKFEKIRLKEIIDSSYEISSFPLLTIFFTLLYTLSIYNNTDIKILNFKTDIIFLILNSVLFFTLSYFLAFSYLKIKVSLWNLCLNVIEEYELDK